jgi:HEAT repeat protein
VRNYCNLKSFRFSLTVLFVWILIFVQSSYCQDYSLNAVNSLLESNEWPDRAAAVGRLQESDEIDSTTAVNLLITALESEIKNPLSNEHATGTYVSITEFLRNRYCLGLISYGKKAEEIIIPLLNSTSGELHSRLLIVLGHLRNEKYLDDVRRIFRNSPDGYLRLFALRALIKNDKKEDIKLFKDALKDDFKVVSGRDYKTGERRYDYIIRMDAAGALSMRGFKLKPDGDSYIIVSEPESGDQNE